MDPKDMIGTSEVLADELEIKIFNGALFHKEGNSWIQDRNTLFRIIDKRIKLLLNKLKQFVGSSY